MLHNDNIENGMLKFWEKVKDEETGEEFEVERPACECSNCGKYIFADDNCYKIEIGMGKLPLIFCEECIDWSSTYGRDAAQELYERKKLMKRKAI